MGSCKYFRPRGVGFNLARSAGVIAESGPPARRRVSAAEACAIGAYSPADPPLAPLWIGGK